MPTSKSWITPDMRKAAGDLHDRAEQTTHDYIDEAMATWPARYRDEVGGAGQVLATADGGKRALTAQERYHVFRRVRRKVININNLQSGRRKRTRTLIA